MDMPDSPELQDLVSEQLATGAYASADEVLLQGVRLLAERNRRVEALRRELQIGRDQLDRGEFTEHDQESLRALFDEIQTEGRQRYEAAKNKP